MYHISFKLKTRVVALSSLVFLIVMILLSLIAGRIVFNHAQSNLLQQQAHLQQFAVNLIDDGLQHRLDALQAIASLLHDGESLLERSRMQQILDSRKLQHQNFNGGLIIMDANALMIVDSPIVAGRVGIDLSDRDHAKQVKATRQPMISHPLIGRGLQTPVFATSMPILSDNNDFIGYLMGITRLADSNLLTNLKEEIYSGVGTLYVVDLKNNLIVASSRYDLAMHPLPTPDECELLKRIMAGENQGVAQSSFDKHPVAFSAQKLDLMDWLIIHTIPESEFNQASWQLLKTLAGFSVLALMFFGFLIALIMRYQLSPLEQSAKKIQAMMDGRIPQSPLPVKREDEIGVLIDAFNRQVAQINDQALAQMKELNASFLAILDNSTDFIYFKDAERRMKFCSQNLADLTGYPSWREMVGKLDSELFSADTAKVYAEEEVIVYGQGKAILNHVAPYEDSTGQRGWVQTNKWPLFSEDGKTVIGLFGISRDVTEMLRAEQQLRIAASVFESQEGMMVTDAECIILSVNKAFTEITGYSADEVVGQNPKILKSGRQSTAIYTAMWQAINTQGQWEGEIWNRRNNGEIYPEYLRVSAVKDQNGKLSHYVGTLVDITQSKAAADQIEMLAFYDPLTRLANRRLLMERLNHALSASARGGQRGALLFMDLDHFKDLNDTQGHTIGDLLLQKVAERLTSNLRDGDTAARLGGDEFVVLVEGLTTDLTRAVDQAQKIANKLREILNQPYQLGDLSYRISASIGVMLFEGDNQKSDELLKHADIAMYQAKSQGRDAIRFFDPKMQQEINEREAMKHALQDAIKLEQFELYYQMQVDSKGQATGAEALIRWNKPEEGVVGPIVFIPLAEETGLILPIGAWVLNTACAQLQVWQSDPLMRHLVLSVNVSAKQFMQPDFVEQVQAAVLRFQVNPTQLKIELTESLLVDNVDDVVVKMKHLHTQGIRISLDDFGTGYSSLQYLKRLPLDQLKIDQAFVRDINLDKNDRAIVRTIIGVSQGLELDVIAEGVETEAQLAFLFENACLNYQGYLFAKPLPIAEFEARVKSGIRL